MGKKKNQEEEEGEEEQYHVGMFVHLTSNYPFILTLFRGDHEGTG